MKTFLYPRQYVQYYEPLISGSWIDLNHPKIQELLSYLVENPYTIFWIHKNLYYFRQIDRLLELAISSDSDLLSENAIVSFIERFDCKREELLRYQEEKMLILKNMIFKDDATERAEKQWRGFIDQIDSEEKDIFFKLMKFIDLCDFLDRNQKERIEEHTCMFLKNACIKSKTFKKFSLRDGHQFLCLTALKIILNHGDMQFFYPAESQNWAKIVSFFHVDHRYPMNETLFFWSEIDFNIQSIIFSSQFAVGESFDRGQLIEAGFKQGVAHFFNLTFQDAVNLSDILKIFINIPQSLHDGRAWRMASFDKKPGSYWNEMKNRFVSNFIALEKTIAAETDHAAPNFYANTELFATVLSQKEDFFVDEAVLSLRENITILTPHNAQTVVHWIEQHAFAFSLIGLEQMEFFFRDAFDKDLKSLINLLFSFIITESREKAEKIVSPLFLDPKNLRKILERIDNSLRQDYWQFVLENLSSALKKSLLKELVEYKRGYLLASCFSDPKYFEISKLLEIKQHEWPYFLEKIDLRHFQNEDVLMRFFCVMALKISAYSQDFFISKTMLHLFSKIESLNSDMIERIFKKRHEFYDLFSRSISLYPVTENIFAYILITAALKNQLSDIDFDEKAVKFHYSSGPYFKTLTLGQPLVKKIILYDKSDNLTVLEKFIDTYYDDYGQEIEKECLQIFEDLTSLFLGICGKKRKNQQDPANIFYEQEKQYLAYLAIYTKYFNIPLALQNQILMSWEIVAPLNLKDLPLDRQLYAYKERIGAIVLVLMSPTEIQFAFFSSIDGQIMYHVLQKMKTLSAFYQGNNLSFQAILTFLVSSSLIAKRYLDTTLLKYLIDQASKISKFTESEPIDRVFQFFSEISSSHTNRLLLPQPIVTFSQPPRKDNSIDALHQMLLNLDESKSKSNTEAAESSPRLTGFFTL